MSCSSWLVRFEFCFYYNLTCIYHPSAIWTSDPCIFKSWSSFTFRSTTRTFKFENIKYWNHCWAAYCANNSIKQYEIRSDVWWQLNKIQLNINWQSQCFVYNFNCHQFINNIDIRFADVPKFNYFRFIMYNRILWLLNLNCIKCISFHQFQQMNEFSLLELAGRISDKMFEVFRKKSIQRNLCHSVRKGTKFCIL